MVLRFLISSLLLFACKSNTQPEIVSIDGNPYSETIIDPIIEHPKLLTSLDSLRLVFIEKSKSLNFDGYVIVTFTIDSSGRVKEPEIRRGGNSKINKFTKEFVKSISFEPAKQKGKAVSVKYAIPFRSNQ